METARIQKLISRFQAGEKKESFEQLYALFYPRQYYFALRILRSQPAAEDAVQEAFTSAYEKLDTLRDPGAFLVWLNRVTYRACVDQLRRRMPGLALREDFSAYWEEETGEHSREQEDPALMCEKKERRRRLLQALDTLPPAQRSTVLLKYFAGLKEKEIAQAMECPVGTVKSRLSAAKAALAEQMGGLYAAFPFALVGPAIRRECSGAVGGSAFSLPLLPAATVAAGAATLFLAAAVSGGPAYVAVDPSLAGAEEGTCLVRVEMEQNNGLQLRLQETGQAAEFRDGAYWFTLAHNGTYTILAEDRSGRVSRYVLRVDQLDEAGPVLTRYERQGEEVLLFLEDEGGLALERTRAYRDSGEEVRPLRVDEQAGALCFAVKDLPLHIEVWDLLGNPSTFQARYTETPAEG